MAASGSATRCPMIFSPLIIPVAIFFSSSFSFCLFGWAPYRVLQQVSLSGMSFSLGVFFLFCFCFVSFEIIFFGISVGLLSVLRVPLAAAGAV